MQSHLENESLFEDRLRRSGIEFLQREPMRRHTSFRIGGPARWYITPRDANELAALLLLCRETKIPYYPIGNGSNLLVADEGLPGAVIAFAKMGDITREQNTLHAQAGVTLSALCRAAQQYGLAGLEFAYGIPGSVGGAVYMNAGAYGGEMKDVVASALVLDPENQEIQMLPSEQLAFGYRQSRFQQSDELVCGAVFALHPGDGDEIDALMKQTLQKRVDKQPLELPSAGSAFRRPPNGYAAALIDQCGLKGFAVGGAMVSPKHAGFVVNTGNATCADVLTLLKTVRDRVEAQTGTRLETEVKYLH